MHCAIRLLKYAPRSDVDPPTIDFSFEVFDPADIPAYTILSHRWLSESDEVTFEDLKHGDANGHVRSKDGYKKLEFCAKQAAKGGFFYFWIDTCCIDKKNPSEESEAIRSMFKWYKNAAKCYVYMLDLPDPDPAQSVLSLEWKAEFRKNQWFTRGWTLQELIAPKCVEFFSHGGIKVGNKKTLKQDILQATGLPINLLCGAPLSQFTIEERLDWAARRETTEEEDAAYCIVGLFGIHIIPQYGEGKESAMNRLLEAIQPSQSFALSLMVKPPWIVPFERNERFIGRETELATLEQRLFIPDKTSKWAVTGLGGVGKTQLVLELLYRIRATHKECMVLWIDAATSESLYQGYSSLARKLNLPGRHGDIDCAELVQGCLEKISTGQWVLVFDNADDIDLWTKPRPINEEQPAQGPSYCLIDRLPRNEQGCIIFTTRSEKVANTLVGSNIIPLSSMDEETAVNILKKYLVRPNLINNADTTAMLLAELAYIPLAIVQAAAHINTTGCSLLIYLQLLDEQEEEVISLLSESLGAEGRHYNVKNPIATTWLISFEHIQRHDPLAAEYLSILACVHYKDVPLSLLPQGPSRLKQENAIGTLVAYSLVERREADSTLHLHRLVHLATRNWLRKEKILDVWEAKTCARLEEVFPSDDHENRSIWRTYLPHIIYFLGSSQAGEPIKQRLSLITKGARCLFRDGRFNEAEVLFTQVQAAYNRTSESESSDLENTTWLAANSRSQGRWQEAEELEVKVMKTSKSKLGVDHADTLTIMSNLASTYQAQGRWKEAEHLQLRVVNISKSKLGIDHPITLLGINNLASTYQNYERWDDAEQLQTQVLEIYKSKFGADHPDTLTIIANLASTYLHQGRWQEAEQLDLQVVETSKDKLGTDHPDTIASMAGLASTYWNQERWEDAEKLFVQVVEAQTSKLGADHPDTLTCMANLASTYQNLGRWQKAEELGLQVMETRKRKLGMNHPDTLISINNLASIYQKQKR